MSIYSKTLSRRDLLTLLSVSVLPLSSLATHLYSDTVNTSPKRLKSIKFKGMAAPSMDNPAEMATVTVNSALQVTLDNGQLIDYALDYQSFFMTGTPVPDGSGGTVLAGGYYNIDNQPIIDTTVKGKERQFFSDCPDGTSLIQLSQPTVKGINGNTVFAVVQFEYTSLAQDGRTTMYGQLPSPIAVLTLDQNPITGQLKLIKYHNVDTSSVYGLWITCGSSLSPWGTHLSSEEYEPDAFELMNNPEQATVLQGFSQHLFGHKNTANPYHYGHIPEVTVNPDGTGKIKKHYCMGRFSHELVQVMPDNRTVLMGDDATNAGLFVFIANKAADLSSGTLYVAQLSEGFSIDASNKNTTHLSWIKLGTAHSDDILNLANRLKPSDIMTVKIIDPQDNAYTKITVNGKVEWVILHKGMAHAAAFLETHRYAALMGASLGFSKMEGTTVNIKDKIAYQALQNIHSSMVSGHKANVINNGINLPKAIHAGAILQYYLSGNLQDTDGVAINSEWMPANIGTLLVGQDITPDIMGNTANPNWIANPDNLKFSETLRTLFIGEDSTQHINSYLWAYHVDTQELVRLASMPVGAEATGLHIADNINGWTYILSNFQHAGDWSKIHQPFKHILEPLLKNNYQDKFSATVGYLTCKII
ncbi:MAG: hypothetical protein RL344_97 [Pseudomonadota bacterium]